MQTVTSAPQNPHPALATQPFSAPAQPCSASAQPFSASAQPCPPFPPSLTHRSHRRSSTFAPCRWACGCQTRRGRGRTSPWSRGRARWSRGRALRSVEFQSTRRVRTGTMEHWRAGATRRTGHGEAAAEIHRGRALEELFVVVGGPQLQDRAAEEHKLCADERGERVVDVRDGVAVLVVALGIPAPL